MSGVIESVPAGFSGCDAVYGLIDFPHDGARGIFFTVEPARDQLRAMAEHIDTGAEADRRECFSAGPSA
jgi:hypothetical protein